MADYELHPEVVWVARPDASSRLLHLDGNTCGLDAGSTSLLHAILQHGVGRSSADLAARAAIPADDARHDVLAFVSDLRRQRIVRASGARVSNAEALRTRAARGFVALGVLACGAGARRRTWRAWGVLLAARSSIALFGWAKTRAAWERTFPPPVGAHPPDRAGLTRTIDDIVRAVASRSLLHHQCKERALACLALVREAGIGSELIIGLAYTPLRAHVWVEAEGRVISDDPEHCRAFEPIPLDNRVTPPVR